MNGVIFTSNFYREQLGSEQKRVFQRMVNGENIFLTGNAGTGKSFIIKAYTEYCEENGIKLLKAAPTGVAACNIQGVTLHRLFKLKTDVKSMLEEVKSLPPEVESKLNLCSVILFDELPMTRIDVFDRIMRIIEYVNKKRRDKKRKPIQLIFVGDFYQLPPVIPPDDKEMLDLFYGCDIGSGFAFQSKYWRSFDVQFEKLTEVRRQDGDKAFCTALDKCKEGDTDCLPFFATETAKEPDEDAVWVVGKNATALEKNEEKLAKIEGQEYSFTSVYEGDASKKDGLCEDRFVCKVGAKVIMLVNDPTGLYQNGTMGTIKSVQNEEITVDIDRTDETGKDCKSLSVTVKRHEFCKYDYIEKEVTIIEKDERGEEVTRKYMELVLSEIGKVKQFPMKLGFAITIHKAQGQTYDKMNFMPEIFQDGQLYVALSRCRFADKLYIASPLNPRMVRTSQEVVNYYKNPDEYSFFGTENDVISVQTYRECEGAVRLLTNTFGNHKAEILDFLQALEKRDKREKESQQIKEKKKKKEEIPDDGQLSLLA